MTTEKFVTKRELKSVYGIPYCFTHLERREARGCFLCGFGSLRTEGMVRELEAWIASHPRV
ncbi:prophage regulatory protein [Bradyrhizobium sp. LB1.3]